MGDSSDSEEFYDAEEFTPIKGSKRSSMIQLSSGSSESLSKDRAPKIPDNPSLLTEAPHPSSTNVVAPVDDKHAVENVVQGRKRFQELRRHMQTEEEDDGADIVEQARHSYTQEHPFKIIAHDTMSLQSMTSLGRIGRLLSGASESHSNLRETMTASSNATSREPSTISDDAIAGDSRNQTVLAMSEPDVIASTKANSLRSRPAAAVSAGAGAGGAGGAASPRPAPPPRPPRRKRKKLYGSQSLSTTDGDNLSLCTVNTDDMNYTFRPTTKPLLVEAPPSQLSSHSMSLPSPASTIESLTRQFQDSLELEHSRYASDMSGLDDTAHKVEATPQPSDYSKGDYTTKLEDDRIERGTGSRTHSESRANVSTASHNRRRRVSCGDEQQARDKLSDQEILAQVTVLNLDTGERLPLSIAEHKLPQCINPLSLQIMRLTSEYYGRENDENVRDTDEESESVCASGIDEDAKETKQEALDKTTAIRRKTEKLKRFFGSTVKKTVDAAKSLAQEVSHARHKEDVGEIPDEVRGESIKLKASNSHKGPYDFDGCVRHVQEMDGAHVGAVWCCRWSECGRLLATCGQDRRLRLWCTRDAFPALQEMRAKYNAEQKSSPTPSQESLCSLGGFANTARGTGIGGGTSTPLNASAVFCETPFAVYSGHTSDLLDVSWSKNNFILSSSMDKTVRLWHISRLECLCCFQHIDFVTAIVFHPRDDRYFLSGSLDGKLRLWNIPDKKVAVWNEVDGKTKLITAANFCQNGKFAVVGTYDGRCIFYTTDQLKYHTQIDVRSTRGKNSTGRKISGIEPMPNDDKILITSNDSRIRLYDLRDLNLSCKYKGYVNVSSQIKASFSHDGKYIVSGSENQCIYIWKTHHDYSKFTSVRRDRNDFWEGIKAHNAVVTCSVFAPNPDYIIRMIEERERMEKMANKEFDDKAEEEAKTAEGGMVASSQTGHVLVSADFNGCIKVFVHKAKPKHSSLPASALA